MNRNEFLPTTKKEMNKRGWDKLDVILISGDAYIDSPFMGVAVVGRILESIGLKVGIIGQPDINSDIDIKRLGEPKLFWGVSGGSIDSMVSNYTATKKFRNSDDYTPGGKNNKRPDRATLVYTNLIRRYFKNTVPIVLGGIEASLRRLTHYDYWSNKLRKPILFDTKADYMIYGMGEQAIIDLGNYLKEGKDPKTIKGVCYISKEPVYEYEQIPSHDECLKDKEKYIDLFRAFYDNNDPVYSKGLCQKVDTRYLIQNPPSDYLEEEQMDKIASFPYQRDLHPYHKKDGNVKCLETIKFSIMTHHGCWGECNFCAIAVHQGRTIRTRSEKNIIQEAKHFTKMKDFKGVISDVGGPTANMYGYECKKKLKKGTCIDNYRCVDDKRLCKAMKVDHSRNIQLLKDIREVPGVKKAFVASGVRYDLITADKKHGYEYLKQMVNHHISGQMKVAPEHTSDEVLYHMGKPGKQTLIDFKRMYDKLNKESGKKQFLTYYLIAAHPGCKEKHMHELKQFTTNELKMNPEQAQVFTPTPGTYSAVMYYTEMDPFTKKKVFVEKETRRKEKQKEIVIKKTGFNKNNRRKNYSSDMQG
ncbi:YgiQ family radical SAM protein [Malaciobacter halophilus]|uniref:YgiQ family radical SAM protein n=1 Tax=Malaciobacter halophilus TaxID=197482 RepID=A0A2N1J5R9_9BACT|nr:YgiQ family radical SAM protein [Malaciobacter halophilus]AXH09280.1 YgiQ family radical SAM protein [Malaciobacter halophilus]PKI81915.1 YgiQ family radical SAM protein [Malaciobacter halophilus]